MANNQSLQIPPVAVASAAQKGLTLRQKFHRGGTAIGVARARDLKNRQPVSDEVLTGMARYFAHHEGDRRDARFGDDDNPSPGYVAWLLWGGDAGKAWSDGKGRTADLAAQAKASRSH